MQRNSGDLEIKCINLFLSSRIFCVCVQEGALKKSRKNDNIFCCFSSEHTKLQMLTCVEIGHFGTFLLGIFALGPNAMRKSLGLGMSTCAWNVWIPSLMSVILQNNGHLFVYVCAFPLLFPLLVRAACPGKAIILTLWILRVGGRGSFTSKSFILLLFFTLLMSSLNTCCLFVNLVFCLQILSFFLSLIIRGEIMIHGGKDWGDF